MLSPDSVATESRLFFHNFTRAGTAKLSERASAVGCVAAIAVGEGGYVL
jgi:hypothetical protein